MEDIITQFFYFEKGVVKKGVLVLGVAAIWEPVVVSGAAPAYKAA
jgi:hypothetical protein